LPPPGGGSKRRGEAVVAARHPGLGDATAPIQLYRHLLEGLVLFGAGTETQYVSVGILYAHIKPKMIVMRH
jgi:hypothetical protein